MPRNTGPNRRHLLDGTTRYTRKLGKYLEFHVELDLTEVAARIKCGFSIAIADCFSIAIGLHLNCLVLFLQEKELPDSILEEMREKYGVRIAILK